jgi:hypothetical protein
VNKFLTTLRDLLQEEVELHDTLRRELEQEAESDGDMSAGTLLRIQVTKNQCAQRIQYLEEQRISVVRNIETNQGRSGAGLTLKQIIPLADEALGQELKDCHQHLQDALHDIRDLARLTGENAHARLQAVDATLAVINEAVRMHPTYSDEGRLHNKPPTFKYTSA